MYPDRTLFHLLHRHAVPFVIVGGHAVHYHGHERMTEDADVVWMRSPEADARLLAALEEANARYIGNDIDPATGIERLYPISAHYIESRHLMMLWTNVGFLDLFDFIPGYPDQDPTQLMHSSVEADGLRFVSIDWLRKMKEKGGRSKDLLDLERLPKA